MVWFAIVVLAGLSFAGWLMSHPSGPQREDDFPPSLSRTWSPVAWATCAWSLLRVGRRRIRLVATVQRGGDK